MKNKKYTNSPAVRLALLTQHGLSRRIVLTGVKPQRLSVACISEDGAGLALVASGNELQVTCKGGMCQSRLGYMTPGMMLTAVSGWVAQCRAEAQAEWTAETALIAD